MLKTAKNKPQGLPAPSLLQKIEAQTPGAAEEILARATDIQCERHRNEKQNLSSQEYTLRAVIKSITSLFQTVSESNKPTTLRSPNDDLRQVGNDLRQAILEYLENDEVYIDDFEFTKSEFEDLLAVVFERENVTASVTMRQAKSSPFVMRPKSPG